MKTSLKLTIALVAFSLLALGVLYTTYMRTVRQRAYDSIMLYLADGNDYRGKVFGREEALQDLSSCQSPRVSFAGQQVFGYPIIHFVDCENIDKGIAVRVPSPGRVVVENLYHRGKLVKEE